MDCLLNIGNRVDAKSADYLKSLIKCVFEDGFKNHASDTVLVKALEAVTDAFKVEKISINGSSFVGNPDK